MVLDTVHSSGVGRIHGGMKIARPFQDAKFMLTPDMVAENKKGSGVESKSRPGLVIRRRIMVRHADEVAGGPPTPALSSHPPTAHENSPKHQQSDIVRSTAQDQSPRAMTKPTKTLRLFDLNKLPSVQESILSPGSSTVESADSATTDHHAAMATKSSDLDAFFSSSSEMKRLKGGEGGGLAVDLGVLPPLPAAIKQQFAFRKPQAHAVEHVNSFTVPTPTRKRLRKLSDYVDRGTTDSMAKLWTTTGEGDGCNNRDDVTKTVAPSQADSKARCRHPDVDDEVFSAVAALLMLSSSAELQSEASTDLAAAASDTEEPCRSSGSGSSVLLRPSNKRRYRSVAEIMATTPIVKRRV